MHSSHYSWLRPEHFSSVLFSPWLPGSSVPVLPNHSINGLLLGYLFHFLGSVSLSPLRTLAFLSFVYLKLLLQKSFDKSLKFFQKGKDSRLQIKLRLSLSHPQILKARCSLWTMRWSLVLSTCSCSGDPGWGHWSPSAWVQSNGSQVTEVTVLACLHFIFWKLNTWQALPWAN